MNFEEGKTYFLRFFYTGIKSGDVVLYSDLTGAPQKRIDSMFNGEEFDEGFVIICATTVSDPVLDVAKFLFEKYSSYVHPESSCGYPGVHGKILTFEGFRRALEAFRG